MTVPRRVGLLGGTFDPLHYGHLDTAEAARAALDLDEVLFIPSHVPPHRPRGPHASAYHRFAMIAVGIEGWPAYRVSDIELDRHGASYTVDTLRALHAGGFRASQLFFVLGTDACAEIATWRQYPDVLDLAHFVVIARPGGSLDEVLVRTPTLRARARTAVGASPDEAGTGVYLVEAHTRDVSSTTVRARLSARAPIDDLVPAAVARHITAHHLYETVDDLHGQDEDTRNSARS